MLGHLFKVDCCRKLLFKFNVFNADTSVSLRLVVTWFYLVDGDLKASWRICQCVLMVFRVFILIYYLNKTEQIVYRLLLRLLLWVRLLYSIVKCLALRIRVFFDQLRAKEPSLAQITRHKLVVFSLGPGLAKYFLRWLIAESNLDLRFSYEYNDAFFHSIDQAEVLADLYAKAWMQLRDVL